MVETDQAIALPNHDDGAELVKQVLEQNPPEEQGIREEWDSHVGWHREENIRGAHVVGNAKKLRGSSSYNKPGEKQDQQEQDPQRQQQNPLISDKNNNHDGFTIMMTVVQISGLILVVALLLRWTHSRLRPSRGQKER